MNRSSLMTAAAAALALGLLGWQSWTVAGLQGRVAVLEQVAATNLGGGAASVSGAKSQEVVARAVAAVQAAQTEAQGRGLTEDQTQELIEEALQGTLEDTLDAREERKKAEETEKWVAMAGESMELEIEELAEEHDISEGVQEQVLDLLVDATRDAVDLRRAIGDGDMSVREAKAEGKAIEADMVAELDELLGVEISDELADKIRPDRPWERGE